MTEAVLDDAPYLDVADPTFSIRSQAVAAARAQSWFARTPYGLAVLRYDEVQSPHGGFRYDFQALSVQVHPELDAAYVRTLLHSGAVGNLAETTIAEALATLGPSVEAAAFATGFARFYRQGLGTGPA